MRVALAMLALFLAMPLACRKPAPASQPLSETACVDNWLGAHGLNSYGDPPETMYAGGNPLFDERTGETRDRLEYVYARQPQARTDCQRDR